MADQIEQLSPVWKSLPVEMVLEILDCLIEDILNTCQTYHINADYNWFARARLRSFPYYYQPPWDDAERQATRALLTAEAVLRQGCDLFNSHKPRIERYFRDEWLSTMVFLVCVDSSRGYYYRYFSVPQQTQDMDDHTSSVADTRGQATFFLHTPPIIVDQWAGEHFGFPRVITQDLPQWTDTVWVPLNEQQGLEALLTDVFWENDKNDNILNEDHPFFMVGSIPSEFASDWFSNTSMDPRSEVPMGRNVLSHSNASPMKVEGLEVHDGGRRIRFKWHHLIPEILHTIYAVEGGIDDEGENSIW